ncbi:sigma-54-dependent transcriptional regulator [Vibrio spartinae]|uniref:Transcriptional regulatory protein ZraR n=1 Tax=Vibrio spartinae TaxID=1918945 RepID=A0ABX6R0H8_9VIBR|nr:sigma-54 dependent transcriptional regulator [Vibrio spartinae]QMV15016.1 Transcriptional regulatory protein ZraR [Vibrio spartinae]
MHNQQYRVLVADDDENILNTLRLILKVRHFDVVTVHSPELALEQVKQADADIALIDLNYQLDTTSGQEGLDLIQRLKTIDSELPIVVMTGWGSVDIAVEAMKYGAVDFVEKPWDNERLVHILNTQIRLSEGLKKQFRLQQQNQLLQEQLNLCAFDNIVALSPVMKNLMESLMLIVESDANILLTGENGTGKSLLASYIHRYSSRAEQEFISVDMSCIPDTLFESEMFGHVKGAFTDAKQQRIGRFELADGGTLFLDEIGNMPVSQQSKLLRVLEEKQFEKVGGAKTQQVDVRVVSATNADLNEMIGDRSFRQDLFYRLNTFEFRVPSLRERVDDIIPLIERFGQIYTEKYRKPIGELTDEAIAILQSYDWPGNVRELSHVVERLVLLSQGKPLDKQLLKRVLPDYQEGDMPQSTLSPSQRHLVVGDGAVYSEKTVYSDKVAHSNTLEEIELEALKQRLDYFDGNASLAAESLGLSRSAFYRRLGKTK